MILKNRHIREALYILDLDYPVSIDNLSKEIGVNKRTLRNDLNTLSDFFKSERVCFIRETRMGSVCLKNTTFKHKDKIREKLFYLQNNATMDKNKRLKKILIDCLMKEKIPTIEEWSFELNVSRPTVANDIKQAKKWLKERELGLNGKPGKGYALIGEEEKIRNAIVQLILQDNSGRQLLKNLLNKDIKKISSLSNSSMPFLKGINLLDLRDFVKRIEINTKTKLTDIDYLNLVLKSTVSIMRIKEKKFVIIKPKKLFSIMQSPEYEVVYNEMLSLEPIYRIKISPEEAAYITLYFISSKVQELPLLKNVPGGKHKEEYNMYAEEVAKITENVFEIALAKDVEFMQMLSLHLKSTLKKIKYGIKIENPLLETIRLEYPLPFSIAEYICTIIGKKMHLKIPEEEVGYIAMYIAMAVEKVKYKEKKKKVAVVCAVGMGTSSLLFWRLLNEMPDVDVVQVGSYQDILEGKINPDVDLILSTIPLPQMKIPHIVISPLLSASERRKIREILGITRQKWRYPSIYKVEKLLDSRLIFVNVEAKQWEDVILLLSNALSKNGYVKKGFIKAILQREKEFPTGLQTPIPIALPHADINYTIKDGIALATLKKPVNFKEMRNPKSTINAKIVVLPVLTRNSKDKTVFYEIFGKCRNYKIAHRLINCTTPQAIKAALVKAFAS